MNYKCKNEIFFCFYEFDQEISDLLVVKIFVLLSKYYPGFEVSMSDFYNVNENTDWRNVVLNSNSFFLGYTTVFRINVPLYYQKNESEIEQIFIDEGISIFYGVEDTTGRNSLGVDFYANLYTNEIYKWEDSKKIPIDQSLAAPKNRIIMTDFLKELEVLLDGEVTESLSPFYLSEEHIHKYGIKDAAVKLPG